MKITEAQRHTITEWERLAAGRPAGIYDVFGQRNNQSTAHRRNCKRLIDAKLLVPAGKDRYQLDLAKVAGLDGGRVYAGRCLFCNARLARSHQFFELDPAHLPSSMTVVCRCTGLVLLRLEEVS